MGNPNKFGQIQELINDNYSDIKLYSNFHIEYKAIAFIANKKEPTITCLSRHYQWLPRYGSGNGEFVHKANAANSTHN